MPLLVLIAPDKFKGTLGAAEAAEALAEGVRRALPEADTDLRPVADGGEGTLDSLLAAAGGEVQDVTVHGPLGAPVRAPIAWLNSRRGALEMATASGLGLVPASERDALRASSVGLGELVRAALEQGRGGGPVELVVGMGGSASTDGGTGAASAVGWRFLDTRGRELPAGGGSLRGLRRIDGDGAMPELYEASITGASDIDNPLTGPRGAAAVFGPQKGASEAEVEILEEGLARLAEQVTADLGRDLAGEPGAGAAGGMGFGLLAFFDARLVPGFEIVARAIELDAAIRRADVVLTGEGRLDDSSLGGKSPVGVARIARHHAVPCLAVAGEVAVDPRRLAEEGIERAVGLIDVVGAERATDDTAAALVEAAEGLLKEHLGL